jgi:hypothetical protein
VQDPDLSARIYCCSAERNSEIRGMMDKARILEEIWRVAKDNGDKPPGIRVFQRQTGIRKSDWFPDLWLRWSDALIEAGFVPNGLQAAYSKDFLVEKFLELVRELGHIPVWGEFRLKSRTDKAFPRQHVFYREGKEGLLLRAIRYCQDHPGHEDVSTLCSAELKQSSEQAAQIQKVSAQVEASRAAPQMVLNQ